jgi:hypothetical protein
MSNNIFNLKEIIDGSYLSAHSDLIDQDKITNYITDISVSNPDNDIIIYKCNNWEFTYYKNKLYMICVYNRNIKESFDKTIFDLSIDSFHEYLTKHKLSWVLENKFKTDGQTHIFVSSGCNVIIDSDLLKIDQLFVMVE